MTDGLRAGGELMLPVLLYVAGNIPVDEVRGEAFEPR